jgi:hypothetical protein
VEIGDVNGVLGIEIGLLIVSGQAAKAIGQGTETGFDAPADGLRGEALCFRISRRDLNFDLMPFRGRLDRRTDKDRVGAHDLNIPAGLGRPLEQDLQSFDVVDIGWRDQNGKGKTENAGQGVPLYAFDLLVLQPSFL